MADCPYRMRKRNQGTHVAYIHDVLTDIMFLLSGTVYTTMSNPNGNRVIVETLTGSTILAPAFVYLPDNRLPVNIIAKTDVQLLYINRDAFAELLHKDKQIMINFIAIISDRMQRLSRRMNEFALQSLRERVLGYLVKNRLIDSVEWLSQILGVTRPSLSRVLSELKKEGIIERTIDGIELKR